MQPLQICIGPIIRIGRESWCLPYAGFFCIGAISDHNERFSASCMRVFSLTRENRYCLSIQTQKVLTTGSPDMSYFDKSQKLAQNRT